MKRHVLCFGSGNEGDNLAWKMCDCLKGKMPGFDFFRCESPFDVREHMEQETLIIMDIVKGIEKPRLFTDLDDFAISKKVTAHDLDLGFLLKILENVRNSKFRIIGLPYGKETGEMEEDVKRLIFSS